MKKMLLMLAIISSVITGAAQGVNFQDLTLEKAIAKAKTEGKHVFVDTYTDWCGPCIMMTKQIFPMKEMGDYFNKKYVSVKFNAEKGEEGPAVKNKYGIKAYPTFLVINGDGELIHMFAGGVLSLEFINKVEDSFNPDKAFGVLKKRYDSGEREKKLVANYIKSLQGTYTTDITEILGKFEESLSVDEKICEECLFMFDDMASLDSPRADFLLENLDKFRNVLGRKLIDKMLTKKYAAYYSGILGNQRALSEQDLIKKGEQLKKLKLMNSTILSLYQKAIQVRTTKEGGNEFYKMINKSVDKIEKDELEIFLYFSIPATKELWNSEQLNQFISLSSNDRVRETIKKCATSMSK